MEINTIEYIYLGCRYKMLSNIPKNGWVNKEAEKSIRNALRVRLFRILWKDILDEENIELKDINEVNKKETEKDKELSNRLRSFEKSTKKTELITYLQNVIGYEGISGRNLIMGFFFYMWIKYGKVWNLEEYKFEKSKIIFDKINNPYYPIQDFSEG